MMKEPWFWRETSISAKLTSAALTPLSALYRGATTLRGQFTHPYVSPVPVICVGNATLGGVGKTPFAIMLAHILTQKGYSIAFASRGYGGLLDGPVQIDPQKHTFTDVGDEPLLLAKHAPTFVAKNRRLGVKTAASSNADIIIMDDGFQNPTVAKDVAILLTDTNASDNNMRVFPAGPYREPLEAAKARADLVIQIGNVDDAQNTDLNAYLVPNHHLSQKQYYAFCGIANPQRFFDMLEHQGARLAGSVSFPDHHQYSSNEIETLKKSADKENATLITTAKDLIRLTPEQADNIEVLEVAMKINSPSRLIEIIETKLPEKKGRIDER